MTKKNFSPGEWKFLLNAPHWVYAALIAADRGSSVVTGRTEAKALEEFLSGYKTRSPLVKEIIAGQKDADDKLKGTVEDAERMLGQVNTLLEQNVGEDEGNAVRDLLMQAGEAVAEAAREALIGDRKSRKEEEVLAKIEKALKATEADKRRRHEAAVAAEAERLAQEAREAEAKKRAAEAEAKRKAAEAEARRKAAEAEAKRKAAEAEAQRRAAEAQRRAAEAEAKRKAAEAEAKRKAAEAEAKRLADEAEAKKMAEELEAQKAAEAAAETMRIYVVKPGDTLSGIARQMYGNAGRWPEIFEANRDRIKKANLIRPGWKLRIPD